MRHRKTSAGINRKGKETKVECETWLESSKGGVGMAGLYWGRDEAGEIHLVEDVILHKSDLYLKGHTMCGIRLSTRPAPLIKHSEVVFGRKDPIRKTTCEKCMEVHSLGMGA